MALFDHLFNRKGQLRGTHNPNKEKAIMNQDKEDETDRKEDNMNHSESDSPGGEETYEVLEREIHPAKIICPDCGGITLEGLDFCDKCGGELH